MKNKKRTLAGDARLNLKGIGIRRKTMAAYAPYLISGNIFMYQELFDIQSRYLQGRGQ